MSPLMTQTSIMTLKFVRQNLLSNNWNDESCFFGVLENCWKWESMLMVLLLALIASVILDNPSFHLVLSARVRRLLGSDINTVILSLSQHLHSSLVVKTSHNEWHSSPFFAAGPLPVPASYLDQGSSLGSSTPRPRSRQVEQIGVEIQQLGFIWQQPRVWDWFQAAWIWQPKASLLG